MKDNNLIAIVTATYNRKKLLSRLYKSLQEQTICNFSWIVIDDGSVDGTKQYIESIKNRDIDIRYLEVENGGKCRALNRVFEKFPQYELYVIVDSDDFLNSSAIEQISHTMRLYQDVCDVGALFFRYINKETKKMISGKRNYPKNEIIISRLKHDKLYGKYDGCVAYYNRVIKKYRYPEFKNETYVGPIVLQLLMDPEYKIVFTSKVIGVAEYQSEGISKTGRKLRLNNPKGMIFYSQLLQCSSNIFIQIKYAIVAQAYRILKKLSYEELTDVGILRDTFPLWSFPGGYLLAFYWKYKYR